MSKNLRSHDQTAGLCCLTVVLGAFETAGAVEAGDAAVQKPWRHEGKGTYL